MRWMIGAILLSFSVAACALAQEPQQAPRPLSQPERDARIAQVRDGLRATLAGFVRRATSPDSTPSVRDLPNAALTSLVLGEDPAQAETLLRRLFSVQDADPKSPRFGSVPWQIGHPDIVDDNAIDFSTQAIGPILLVYGDKLSADFKEKELLPYIHAAIPALLRRKLAVSYTNIWLMRTTNMVLIGEAIGDTKAADEGYRELDQWIEYTRQNGVHEFDSPTYTGVDLNDAGLGYLLCARPEGKAKFKAVLDYLWTDFAANYFVARGCLAGPHSRNYSFINSWGGLDVYAYIEGFRSSQKIEKEDFEKIHLVLNGGEKGYHPDAAMFALTTEPERIVQSRFDPDPFRDRYNYLTPDFAIGCAQGAYGAQDKMISVELASAKSGKPLPVMAVIPDDLDSPYGTVKAKDKGGHVKPHHLPPNVTAVQKKGVMLAMLDLDPTHEKEEMASLATNVLIPAGADEIVVDGKSVSIKGPFELPVKPNAAVGVREGTAAVVYRFFQVDGCDGQTPTFFLKADTAGLKEGAARFVAYHYQGTAKMLAEKHVRAGLLIVARECPTDADFAVLQAEARDSANIETKITGKTWEVTARMSPTLTLSAAHDLEHHHTLWRKVNGQDVQSHLLNINDEDYAAKIWAELPH